MVRGPGTGWDLHEYRHSVLTHPGEQGASLLMLMAKSRHKKPENVRRDFKPSPEAISELSSLLAPGDARRRPGCHSCAPPWNRTTARRIPLPATAPGAHAARGTVGPLWSRHVLLCSHDNNRRLAAVPRFP